MANNNIEIEIKLPLDNPEEVAGFLNQNGKLISKDVFQKDTYFVPVHRDFLNAQYPFEWLRLRESSSGNFINYKHFHPENAEKTDYADEFESKIDDVEALKNIFQSLDFKKAVVVEKNRSTWIFDEVEIAIDRVKNLGTFIELEALDHFENPKDGKNFLYNVLKKLNAKVGEEDLRGYPFLILKNN